MEKTISIIIPVFNMEKYLERCIKSVLNQSYKFLEIILVDDGSSDRSLEICKLYARKDERVKVFTKINGGQGSARNLGLKYATGDYVGFVDSDDWIDKDMYKILLENLLEYKADISCCTNVNPEKKDIYIPSFYKKIVLSNYEAMKYHLNCIKGFDHSPVNKIYKKELFNNVQFLELSGYEDTGTVFKLFMKANKVIFEDKPLYYYFVRDNSTMHRSFSYKDLDRIVAYEEMYNVIRKDERYINLNEIVIKQLLGAIYYVLGEGYKSNLYNKKIKNDLKNKCINIEKKNNLNFKNKLLVFIIKINPNIFGFIYKKIK